MDILIKILEAMIPILLQIIAKVHPEESADQHRLILSKHIADQIIKT